MFIPFADGFRFGEAMHPGPGQLACHPVGDAVDSGIRVALGAANVAGLSNKVSVSLDLPAGV